MVSLVHGLHFLQGVWGMSPDVVACWCWCTVVVVAGAGRFPVAWVFSMGEVVVERKPVSSLHWSGSRALSCRGIVCQFLQCLAYVGQLVCLFDSQCVLPVGHETIFWLLVGWSPGSQ